MTKRRGSPFDNLPPELQHALNAARDRNDGYDDDDPRPNILVEPGKYWRAANETLNVMRDGPVLFYRRAFHLVDVVTVDAKAFDGSTTKLSALMPVTTVGFIDAATQIARYRRFTAQGRFKYIELPEAIAKTCLDMIEKWPFPELNGITNCPFLRPDFSLVTTPGYDERTGMVLVGIANCTLPAIPDAPTREHCLLALSDLDDLLRCYPIADKTSYSVALAQLMTAVLRPAMDAAPMFLTMARDTGSGKSHLQDLAALIATGKRCAVIEMGDNPEETEKTLKSYLISGFPIICLDNVNAQRLTGALLCQLTGGSEIGVRLFGTQIIQSVPNTYTVFANGNNPIVAEDMVRRTLTCLLDANCENPWLRQFDEESNPHNLVAKNRGKYVGAILTIARFWHASGEPKLDVPPIVTYGKWCEMVRFPLIMLGCADPVETMLAAAKMDPVRASRVAVFAALHALIGSRHCTVASIIEQLEETTAEIKAAFIDIAATKTKAVEKIDPRILSIWLRKNEGGVSGGFKLSCDRSDRQRPKWFVEVPK